MSTEWTGEDSCCAIELGWDIFDADRHPDDKTVNEQIVEGRPYGYRPFELQAVHEADILPDDNAAHVFVVESANAGDPLALKALAFLKERSPVEYEAVLRHHAEDASGKEVK